MANKRLFVTIYTAVPGACFFHLQQGNVTGATRVSEAQHRAPREVEPQPRSRGPQLLGESGGLELIRALLFLHMLLRCADHTKY